MSPLIENPSIYQRTIQHAVSAKGIGLHKGRQAFMTLLPAPVNHGIVFRRVDLTPHQDIAIRFDAVTDTNLCTVIGQDATVSTIEHLMSALAGLGIDNLLIEIDAEEVPIMDGSSSQFVFLLQSAGIKVQNEAKRFIRIKKHIKVDADNSDGWASFDPYDGFKLTFAIDFNHQAFDKTSPEMALEFSTTAYLKEVSRARTFGFTKDLQKLRDMQLALGANDHNAIGIEENGDIRNAEGLRNKDEFVRHKMLDAIGDLYLLGHPIIGEFDAYKSGHKLNNRLLLKLMNTPDAWELIQFEHHQKSPIRFSDDLVSV